LALFERVKPRKPSVNSKAMPRFANRFGERLFARRIFLQRVKHSHVFGLRKRFFLRDADCGANETANKIRNAKVFFSSAQKDAPKNFFVGFFQKVKKVKTKLIKKKKRRNFLTKISAS
jgi:hypothetical protein